jgi:hypothetical protein
LILGTTPVQAGDSIYVTATLTHSLSEPFDVFFDEATVIIYPQGAAEDLERTVSDRIPAGYVTMSAGTTTCSAASYDDTFTAHNIQGGLATTGSTLLAAGSIIAPIDISNYEGQL